MRYLILAIFTCSILGTPGVSEPASTLSNSQLKMLTGNGINLKLGGPKMGYEGQLKLDKSGKGKGQARTADGNTININGTWAIKGNKFCRKWRGIDGGKEVCETWSATSNRSVDVYNGDQKIGANSW